MKKLNHKAIAAALAAAMALSIPMSASAAWNQNGNGTWNYTNKSGKVTGWNFINGNWYHFNNSGVMSTGWMKDGMNGKWYYLSGSGVMAKGWVKDGGKWYFTDNSGAMKTGWVKTGGKWYNMSASGAMNTGWVKIGEKTYFMNSSGAMQSGVIQIDSEIYYFGEAGDGAMKTGKVEIDGKTYRFDEDGKATGTLKPTPTLAFKTSTSGNPSTTTPVAPSRPSGGGGGGSSGGNLPTMPDDKIPTATLTSINYATFDFTKSYKEVIIDTSTMLSTDIYDLSSLKADQVYVSGSNSKTRSGTKLGLIFGAQSAIINVNVPVSLASVGTLSAVNLNCVGQVDIAASVLNVTANNKDLVVNASGKVINLEATKPTTIKGNGVESISAKSDIKLDASAKVKNITVESGITATIDANATASVGTIKAEGATTVTGAGTFSSVTANANLIVDAGTKVTAVTVNTDNVVVSGAGTIALIEANKKTTVAVAEVVTVNTNADITVAAGSEVKGVNVIATTGTVNVTVNGSVTGAVTKTSGVTVDTSKGTSAPKVVLASAKPVLTTDFTFEQTSSAKPDKGSISAVKENALEYFDGTNWMTIVNTTAIGLAPGTYQIRKVAHPTSTVSVPELVTILPFTGISTESPAKYYVNSVATSGWYGANYYDATDGKKVSTWVPKNGKNTYVNATGTDIGDFGLYKVTGGIGELVGTTDKMEYSTASGGTYLTCTSTKTSITLSAGATYYVRMKADSANTDLNTQVIPVYVSAANMPAAPTGLIGVAPTISSGKGKITGTTAKLEYTADINTTWTSCAATETEVAAGTYYVRVKQDGTTPAGKSSMVVVPAFAAKTSTMSIVPMGTDVYDILKANPFTDAPALPTVTVSNVGSGYKLSGELPYKTGFVTFNTTVKEQQSGHYVFFNLKAPGAVKTSAAVTTAVYPDIKITITSLGGSGDVKTVTAANFDTVDQCGIVYRVDDRMSAPITITVDLDGAGTEYASATYTLDFSGLTLKPLASGQTLKVGTFEELTSALKGVATEIELKEDITLTEDLVIPNGKTVIVPSGKELILSGNSLTNNGTILVNDNKMFRIAADANTAAGTVKLGSDITVNANEAFTGDNHFTGTLDGAGQKITVSTAPTGASYWLSQNATNFIVKDVRIEAYKTEVVGIFNTALGASCTFKNVEIMSGDCAVTSNDNNESSFLCFSKADTLTFDGCVNKLNYSSTAAEMYMSPFIGGYVDSQNFAKTVNFNNCTNYGNVSMTHASLLMGNGSQGQNLTISVTGMKNYGEIIGTKNAAVVGAIGTASLSASVKALNNNLADINGEGGKIETAVDLTGFAVALEGGKIKITPPTDPSAVASYNLCYSAWGQVTKDNTTVGTSLFNVAISIPKENTTTTHGDYKMMDKATATANSITVPDSSWVSLSGYDMKYVIVNDTIVCDFGTYPEADFGAGVVVTLNNSTPTISVVAIGTEGNSLGTVELSR